MFLAAYEICNFLNMSERYPLWLIDKDNSLIFVQSSYPSISSETAKQFVIH